MHPRLRQVTTSTGVRQSVINTGGNLGSTIISAIALIIFSRALGPDGYGVFSTAFSLTLLVARLADFGFNQALQRHLSQGSPGTHNPIQAITLSRLIVIAILSLGGIIASPYIAMHLFHLENSRIIWLSFALVGITIGFDFFTAIYQALQQFLLSAILMFAQASLKLSGALYLMFSHQATAISTAVVYMTAPFIGLLAGVWSFRRYLFQPVSQTLTDFLHVWGTARFMSLAIVAAAVSEQIDVLITKASLDSFQTGQFAAAARIAMFLNLIGMSLGTVLSVRVAKYAAKHHLDAYLKKAILVAVLAAAATLLAIPFGRIAILFTVGPQYLEAIPALSLLLVATAVSNATSPFVALFYLFPKPQYYTYSGVLLMATLIGADLWFIPHLGIVGAGIARIISRGLVLIFTLIYARHAYRHYIASLSPEPLEVA